MNAPENSPELPESSEFIPAQNPQEVKIFIEHLIKKLIRILLKHGASHRNDIPRLLTKQERKKYKSVLDSLMRTGTVVEYSRYAPGYVRLADHLEERFRECSDDLICFCETCTATRWNKFQNQLNFWHRNRFE